MLLMKAASSLPFPPQVVSRFPGSARICKILERVIQGVHTIILPSRRGVLA